VTSEILTAVKTWMTVFNAVIPCGLVDRQTFRRNILLPLHESTWHYYPENTIGDLINRVLD
jgi:hypothetical protein